MGHDKPGHQLLQEQKLTNELQLFVLEQMHNLEYEKLLTYDDQGAQLLRWLIEDLSRKFKSERQFVQQFSLKAGLKKFGKEGFKGIKKEMQQLHDRICFIPVYVKNLMKREKVRAQVALGYLAQKANRDIKGRKVFNGKPTRGWLSKEDSASPTASMESITITCVIDAVEKRDVMAGDIPNAFIQAEMIMEDGKERIIMKIMGPLVDVLLEIKRDTYQNYVVYERGEKVIYVVVLRAIYGMLEAALTWYKKFKKDLESIGFIFNPYDVCVANRMVNGKQHTIRFHVDDILSSHVDPRVNDEFLKWLNKTYGEHGQVKASRGKKHRVFGNGYRISR